MHFGKKMFNFEDPSNSYSGIGTKMTFFSLVKSEELHFSASRTAGEAVSACKWKPQLEDLL